jgi:hypothetical protein
VSRLPAPNSVDRGGGGSHDTREVKMCAPLVGWQFGAGYPVPTGYPPRWGWAWVSFFTGGYGVGRNFYPLLMSGTRRGF